MFRELELKRYGLAGALLLAGQLFGCGQSAPEERVGVETDALVLPIQVSSFAVLATGRATFGDRTAVAGGNVGATATTGDAITVGSAAVFALGKATIGTRIVLKDRASAGDLFTNSLSAPLATFSSLSAFGAPPAVPPIAAFTAGTTPVTANTPSTLAAGNFGVVTVNSTLTLSGGTYQIQNLVLGNNAIVQASAATTVRIAGRITATTSNHVHLITTGTQPASNLRLIVAGASDTTGGVSLGTDAQVKALVVSRAAFTTADRLDFTGALAASNVTLGNDSHVTFATGFECNADADTACNDGNPCTADACTDARCVHTTLANGAACTADSNSCTSDVCSAGACTHPTLADGTSCGSSGGSCGTGTCSTLIGTVTLDKTTVCRGDTVLAQVTTTTNAAAIPNSILIDGKPGGKRYVMLDGVPGTRKIIVTVGIGSGNTEVRELNVQVVDCSGQHFPNLAFTANPFHENVVDLRVLNAADLGASPSYQWDFGDGSSATSSVPYVAHDYGPKLDRDTELSTFQASVAVTPVGGQPQLGKRTAAIPNFYAINKHQRKLMVPTVQQSPDLSKQGSTWVGSYTISNLEDEAISLGSRYLEYQFCDTRLEPQRSAVDQLGVGLAGLQQKSQTLVLDASSIPDGTCRVGVFLVGQSASGIPASARSYFTIQEPAQRPVTDLAWLTVLKQVIDQSLVADPDHITQEDLARLSYEGRITLPDSAPQFQGGIFADAGPTPGGPIIGTLCRPGDLPPAGIQDVTCQAAFDQNGNPDMTARVAQIRNALKGDAVLSVSCSFVGTMLRSLNPPQLFSHTAIMLQNNESLANSTADEDRMVAALDKATSEGPLSPPFLSSTLKYGWPGAITESVSAAYLGDPQTDPDGKSRTLRPLNNVLKKCDGDRTVTGGRVLKAAPGSGDAGRAPLRAAADAAAGVQSSYAFYGYTRSDLAAQQVGGADAPAWTADKIRTECSSFIWQSFNVAATGVELEGQMEDSDLAFSGLYQTSVDGLYGYTSQQRKAAATTLFGQVYNIAQEKGGLPAKILQDVGLDYPSAVANFVTNCFAFDDCANPLPRWRDNGVGEGMAVSPDNMLLWDIYGANEPLQLEQMTATRKYRFAPSAGSAKVAGHVVDAKGNPVPLANVVIKAPDGTGGTLDTQTAPDGSFAFDAVRAGTYVVDADKIVMSLDQQGHKDVTVTAGTPVDDLVIIIEPDPKRRLFNVVGIMGELRDIDNLGDSSIGPVNIDYHLQVNPVVTSASATFDQCVDNDVKLRVVFSASLDPVDDETLHVCVTQGLRDAGIGENACNSNPVQSTPLCVDLAPGASTTFNDGGAFDSSNYKADYSAVLSNTAELSP